MLSVIRGGRKTKGFVGYVKVKMETLSPALEMCLAPNLPPHYLPCHMPEIEVLTRTYFAEGQVPERPQRHMCIK